MSGISEIPELKELILFGMTTAMELPNGVPGEAEIGQGKNWLEAQLIIVPLNFLKGTIIFV